MKMLASLPWSVTIAPVGAFALRLLWLGLVLAGLGVRAELSIEARLAHIVLAYGDWPEIFTPDGEWLEGPAEDRVWRVSRDMVRCISILRATAHFPRLKNIPGIECTNWAWQALLSMNWATCCHDSAAPIFGIAYRLNEVAMQTLGARRACEGDDVMQVLFSITRDKLRWSDSAASHRGDRMVKLWDIWLDEKDRALAERAGGHEVLNASECEIHRRAAVYAYALPVHPEQSEKFSLLAQELLVTLTVSEIETYRGEITPKLWRSLGFRVSTPLWGFLRQWEVKKYHLPASAWSRSFLGEVLALPHGTAPVVLEAGACDGADTVQMCSVWPDAVIHAFEPVPQLRAHLRRAVGRTAACRGRVAVYPHGLAGRDGSATMQRIRIKERGEHSLEGLAVSSLFHQTEEFQRKHWNRFGGPASNNGSMRIRTSSLDAWARKRLPPGGRMDVLRLDLEGAEMQVLRASTELLPRAKLLQVETHPDNSYEGNPATSLDSVISHLQPRGWRLLWQSSRVRGASGSGDAIFVNIAREG